MYTAEQLSKMILEECEKGNLIGEQEGVQY